MTERSRAGWALGALGALPIALASCVAQVKEMRLDGVVRPAPDARSEVIAERRPGIAGTLECREVVVTAPMVREVDIRRSFADDTQERNAALAMLLGAGLAFLNYGHDQVKWPQGGASSAPTTATDVLLGLSAISLGFLVYNAAAVRDSRVLEGVAPETKAGAWRPCSE